MKKDMKKGISLPIEMIVVIAIAVLVLVVIAAFFVGGTSPLRTTGVDQAFGALCAQQMTRCGVAPSSIFVQNVYDLDQNGQIDAVTTLSDVCLLKGIVSTGGAAGDPCRKACGCPS
jgi:FlaG/FlaF family flagellin (archaellin)